MKICTSISPANQWTAVGVVISLTVVALARMKYPQCLNSVLRRAVAMGAVGASGAAARVAQVTLFGSGNEVVLSSTDIPLSQAATAEALHYRGVLESSRPDLGACHVTTYYRKESWTDGLATDHFVVKTIKARKGEKATHVALADGYGHTDNDALIANEARQILDWASLDKCSNDEQYVAFSKSTLKKARDRKFAFGAGLIESLTRTDEQGQRHVEFGRVGDAVGLIFDADFNIVYCTPPPTNQKGKLINPAFNTDAHNVEEVPYAALYFHHILPAKQEYYVITASDGLEEGFLKDSEGPAEFDRDLLTKFLQQNCVGMSPQQIVEALGQHCWKAIHEADVPPAPGDDVTIIVQKV